MGWRPSDDGGLEVDLGKGMKRRESLSQAEVGGEARRRKRPFPRSVDERRVMQLAGNNSGNRPLHPRPFEAARRRTGWSGRQTYRLLARRRTAHRPRHSIDDVVRSRGSSPGCRCGYRSRDVGVDEGAIALAASAAAGGKAQPRPMRRPARPAPSESPPPAGQIEAAGNQQRGLRRPK